MQTTDPMSTFVVPALWPCRLFATSFSVFTTSMLKSPDHMQHAFAPSNAFVSSIIVVSHRRGGGGARARGKAAFNSPLEWYVSHLLKTCRARQELSLPLLRFSPLRSDLSFGSPPCGVEVLVNALWTFRRGPVRHMNILELQHWERGHIIAYQRLKGAITVRDQVFIELHDAWLEKDQQC